MASEVTLSSTTYVAVPLEEPSVKTVSPSSSGLVTVTLGKVKVCSWAD